MWRTRVKRINTKGIFAKLIVVTLVIVLLLTAGTVLYMRNTFKKPSQSRLGIIPTEEDVTTTETTTINETQNLTTMETTTIPQAEQNVTTTEATTSTTISTTTSSITTSTTSSTTTTLLETSIPIGCSSNVDCLNQTECEGNVFYYKNGACGSDNICYFGNWISGTCIQSKQKCGALCDSEADCPPPTTCLDTCTCSEPG